jgi:hypothetical protein
VANPNISQGTLNRIRGSLQWNDFPALNITASYLMPEGFTLAFSGEITDNLPSMTGLVTSPAPYQIIRVTAHLIRAQALADNYKSQIELFSLLGSGTLRPDSKALNPWLLTNCSIAGVEPFTISGRDAGYVLNFAGQYQINSALWN